MCFRPAEIQMKKCAECGAINKPVATKCESCGAPLSEVKIDFDADQAKLDAFKVSAKAPSAPPPATPKPPSPPLAGK